MATVTVSGAHGQTVTLNFDTNANAALAGQLAAAITAGVETGSIVPAVDTDGPPPPLAPGKIGEFVQQIRWPDESCRPATRRSSIPPGGGGLRLRRCR